MNGTQVKLPATAPRWKIVARIAAVVVAATLVGTLMHQFATALERSGKQAGFVHGIVQGALMPCALPNLLAGRDVTIYSQNNTGRMYKLGYTCGVNACGAVFFGILFVRLNRWRKRMNGARN